MPHLQHLHAHAGGYRVPAEDGSTYVEQHPYAAGHRMSVGAGVVTDAQLCASGGVLMGPINSCVSSTTTPWTHGSRPEVAPPIFAPPSDASFSPRAPPLYENLELQVVRKSMPYVPMQRKLQPSAAAMPSMYESAEPTWDARADRRTSGVRVQEVVSNAGPGISAHLEERASDDPKAAGACWQGAGTTTEVHAVMNNSVFAADALRCMGRVLVFQWDGCQVRVEMDENPLEVVVRKKAHDRNVLATLRIEPADHIKDPCPQWHALLLRIQRHLELVKVKTMMRVVFDNELRGLRTSCLVATLHLSREEMYGKAYHFGEFVIRHHLRQAAKVADFEGVDDGGDDVDELKLMAIYATSETPGRGHRFKVVRADQDPTALLPLLCATKECDSLVKAVLQLDGDASRLYSMCFIITPRVAAGQDDILIDFEDDEKLDYSLKDQLQAVYWCLVGHQDEVLREEILTAGQHEALRKGITVRVKAAPFNPQQLEALPEAYDLSPGAAFACNLVQQLRGDCPVDNFVVASGGVTLRGDLMRTNVAAKVAYLHKSHAEAGVDTKAVFICGAANVASEGWLVDPRYGLVELPRGAIRADEDPQLDVLAFSHVIPLLKYLVMQAERRGQKGQARVSAKEVQRQRMSATHRGVTLADLFADDQEANTIETYKPQPFRGPRSMDIEVLHVPVTDRPIRDVVSLLYIAPPRPSLSRAIIILGVEENHQGVAKAIRGARDANSITGDFTTVVYVPARQAARPSCSLAFHVGDACVGSGVEPGEGVVYLGKYDADHNRLTTHISNQFMHPVELDRMLEDAIIVGPFNLMRDEDVLAHTTHIPLDEPTLLYHLAATAANRNQQQHQQQQQPPLPQQQQHFNVTASFVPSGTATTGLRAFTAPTPHTNHVTTVTALPSRQQGQSLGGDGAGGGYGRGLDGGVGAVVNSQFTVASTPWQPPAQAAVLPAPAVAFQSATNGRAPFAPASPAWQPATSPPLVMGGPTSATRAAPQPFATKSATAPAAIATSSFNVPVPVKSSWPAQIPPMPGPVVPPPQRFAVQQQQQQQQQQPSVGYATMAGALASDSKGVGGGQTAQQATRQRQPQQQQQARPQQQQQQQQQQQASPAASHSSPPAAARLAATAQPGRSRTSPTSVNSTDGGGMTGLCVGKGPSLTLSCGGTAGSAGLTGSSHSVGGGGALGGSGATTVGDNGAGGGRKRAGGVGDGAQSRSSSNTGATAAAATAAARAAPGKPSSSSSPRIGVDGATNTDTAPMSASGGLKKSRVQGGYGGGAPDSKPSAAPSSRATADDSAMDVSSPSVPAFMFGVRPPPATSPMDVTPSQSTPPVVFGTAASASTLPAPARASGRGRVGNGGGGYGRAGRATGGGGGGGGGGGLAAAAGTATSAGAPQTNISGNSGAGDGGGGGSAGVMALFWHNPHPGAQAYHGSGSGSNYGGGRGKRHNKPRHHRR